jgi:hypothetical protein
MSRPFRQRPDVRYRQIDGEAVVLRQDAGETLVLNEEGSLILDLLAKGNPPEEVAAELAAAFEVEPEQALADVLRFAAELEDAGILEAACGAQGERPCP